MRFAQWVLSQIATHGYKISEGFLEPDYYVNHNRPFTQYRRFADVAKHRDDWCLSVEGWIFKNVRLYRKSKTDDMAKIHLTREERRQFIEIDKQHYRDLAIEKKRKKFLEQQAALKAQDWP